MNKIACFFILITSSAFSQSISQQVNSYFSSIRSGKVVSPPSSLMNDRKNEKTILSSITPYYKDSVKEVRYSAYSLISNLGKLSSSAGFRQQVVSQLISGWRDADSGINGQVGSSLQQFNQEDFSAAAKDSLRALVKNKPAYHDKLVKLCGYLGLKDQITVLQAQLQSGEIKSKTDKWAVYLALARLGDAEALNYIMTRVRKLGVNDDVVYEIFPDLAYTRQRMALDYLIEGVNSDEKNCEPANPEATGAIPCAYRIMEMIAPLLQNFPLKTDASGDIVTTDYPKALQQVRNWIKENGNYTIITTTY
jgi:hypothetical protein